MAFLRRASFVHARAPVTPPGGPRGRGAGWFTPLTSLIVEARAGNYKPAGNNALAHAGNFLQSLSRNEERVEKLRKDD